MFESYREHHCRNYEGVICPSAECQFECQEGATVSALVAQRIEQGFSKSEAASSILAERANQSAPEGGTPRNNAEARFDSNSDCPGADTLVTNGDGGSAA